MVRSSAFKDFFREIRNTLSRFISITLLLILAVAFFSGLRSTEPDMQLTGDNFFDKYNMYDLKVQSTLGLTDGDLDALGNIEGVQEVCGGYGFDVLVKAPDDDIVIALASIPESGINGLELTEGEMPSDPSECVVDEKFLLLMGLSVGDSFTVSQVQDGFEDCLTGTEFKITGSGISPLYIDKTSKGSSTLGNGSVSSYIFVPESAFSMDYYTAVYATVENAAAELTYSDAYSDLVGPVKARFEDMGAERLEARRNSLVSDAQAELDDARAQLSDAQAEADEKLSDAQKKIDDAQAELDGGYAALRDAQEELDEKKSDGYGQINSALEQLDAADAQLQAGWTAYESAKNRADAEMDQKTAELNEAQDTLNEKQAEVDAGYKALEDMKAQLEAMNADPETYAQEIAQLEAQITAMEQQLQAAQAEIDAGWQQVNAGWDAINQAQAELAASREQLQQNEAALISRRASVNASLAELEQAVAEGQKEIDDGQKELEDGEKELQDAKKEYETAKADAEKELNDAQEKIDDAQREIDDIPQGSWYVFDRDSNSGYAGYLQDSQRMGKLANVFPIIFFLVAALVCLTTMTRMVEDKRIEIGTYKALGYGSGATSAKFLGYGFLASVIGVSIGAAIGMTLIPHIIMNTYGIMYDMPRPQTPVYVSLIIQSLAAAIACTVGATLAACLTSLRERPASLLRPRSPKAGKRIFMEYVPFIWKHMSFFGKVSFRNIFRYKKRFFMTMIGIGGCTALIVTGFGLRSSIMEITDKQFFDVWTYNLQVYTDEDASDSQMEELYSYLDGSSQVAGYTQVRTDTVDFYANGHTHPGYCLAPADEDGLEGYISLRHRKDSGPVALSGDSVVITEKLSELLNIKAGDRLTVIRDDVQFEVTVTDITENYVYHYVYMSAGTYEKIFGEKAVMNELLVKSADASDGTVNSISSELLTKGAVNYVATFNNISSSLRKSMSSINYVVAIILVSAAALAFVVLYNLNNINIAERQKELATIKVLGFFDGEVSWYIVRENVFLTLLGTAAGLLGGRYMLEWLITSVEVDIAMFNRSAGASCYLLAAALTILFAVIVNVLGHVKMKSIDMIESLKSAE